MNFLSAPDVVEIHDAVAEMAVACGGPERRTALNTAIDECRQFFVSQLP